MQQIFDHYCKKQYLTVRVKLNKYIAQKSSREDTTNEILKRMIIKCGMGDLGESSHTTTPWRTPELTFASYDISVPQPFRRKTTATHLCTNANAHARDDKKKPSQRSNTCFPQIPHSLSWLDPIRLFLCFLFLFPRSALASQGRWFHFTWYFEKKNYNN